MAPSRVLLVGDGDHPEFREAANWLSHQTDLRRAKNVEAAVADLDAGGPPPDVIVLAQPRPGMMSQGEVERLHARAPLSALVALLGSWCEGEPRTGQPWPGVVRVYWHQWLPRCERELGPDVSAERSVWRLPRTMTETEQLLYARDEWSPQGRGVVAIHADRVATFDALADACQAAGYCSVWLASSRQFLRLQAPSALLWDGQRCGERQAEQIRSLAAAFRPAPLVALLDLVRLDDYERALAAGAAAVLAKPFLLSDLFCQLNKAIGAMSSDQSASPAA